MKQFYAYTHARPDGSIFYVGKGHGRRATDFSSRNAHHTNTVRKYGKDGVRINKLPCASEAAALSLEKVIIKALRIAGVQTANWTDGGEGTCGLTPSPETKAKILASRKGYKHSPETRAKIAAAHRGKVCSDEQKERLRKLRLGVPLSEEAKRKMSVANKGKKFPPEFGAKMSIIMTGRTHTEETKKKLSEIVRTSMTPERRAEMSRSYRGRKQSEETRAKRAESMRAAWKRRKAGNNDKEK